MGRAPCCDKANVKKGPWSPEEDAKLKDYIDKNGTGGNWILLPQKAGLRRCGKSCRLRWLNYLRPNIKHGEFTCDEDRIICTLFATIGSRWSIIAGQLPGRTDNDIKNYWNTKLKKKLMGTAMLPNLSKTTVFSSLPHNSSSPPSLSSSPSSYKYSDAYNHQPRTFTALEPPISYSSSFLSNFSFTTDPPLHHYQPTCSSSDGSCNNQVNHHGTEIEYQNNVCDLQNCLNNNGNQDHPVNQNSIVNHQYGTLEEIRQLISTSNTCGSNFLFDENNTEERAMYYY